MALPPGDVIGILTDNLRLRGSVLPLSKRRATRWARGLGLPRGGETVLYTGLMYQLVPSIEFLVEAALKLDGTPVARLTGLGRRLNRRVNLSAFAPRPSREERDGFDRVLTDIATLLRETGVELGYLYEDDLYTGALAWDLGADEVVVRHAQKVAALFRKHGVRNAITVDPHTTAMLRTVYPEIVEGFDVNVRSYLEVLAERRPALRTELSGEVALHDSCLYARAEGVVDEPRALLAGAGLAVREPAHAGRLTWCCGGPAESLFPEKAIVQAGKRVEELHRVAPEGVTMCPLCLVNLQRAADGSMPFRDISHYLMKAYGPAETTEVRT